MKFLLVTHTQILMPIKIEGFFENKLRPTTKVMLKYVSDVIISGLKKSEQHNNWSSLRFSKEIVVGAID